VIWAAVAGGAAVAVPVWFAVCLAHIRAEQDEDAKPLEQVEPVRSPDPGINDVLTGQSVSTAGPMVVLAGLLVVGLAVLTFVIVRQHDQIRSLHGQVSQLQVDVQRWQTLETKLATR